MLPNKEIKDEFICCPVFKLLVCAGAVVTGCLFLVKEVVTRDYDFHGDYIDTMSSQPLMKMEQVLPKETMH